MNFGKYSILDGVTHYFEDEPDWYWKIKPVTAGQELEMSKFATHNRWVIGPDGKRIEQPPTTMEFAFHEIALSFGGTNIPKELDKPVESGGEPILAADASPDEIKRVLALMPRSMLMEIWRAVGEAYPFWGPSDPNAI